MTHYRHGDVSFHRIEKLPDGLRREEHKTYIVAYGEASGHHHTLNSPVRLKRPAGAKSRYLGNQRRAHV